MGIKCKLVHGWGINDVDYDVYRYEKLQGKSTITWVCPYYLDWKSVIQRCHSKKWQANNVSYVGCTVTEEWKHLSNFIKWVDSQPNKNWQNCELDKDFLIEGNKHYCADTVVYIPKKVNSFTIDQKRNRGNLMVGVSPSTEGKKKPFVAQCQDPFNINGRHIGYFNTELEAHKAWQAKKHEYACQLADLQQDPRIAKALRERYAPNKDWTNK